MKSLEKLQKAVSYLNGREDSKQIVELITEFMRDNEPTPKNGKDIWKFAANDELIPAMNGVYHDPEKKMAVACNKHILLASKEEYREEFSGKIVDKYNNEIEGRYPAWQRVIPRVRPNEYRIDAARLTEYMKEYNTLCKVNGLKAKDKEYHRLVVSIDGKCFARLGNMLKASAWTDTLNYLDGSRALCKETEEQIVLVMPMYICNENELEHLRNHKFCVFNSGGDVLLEMD